MNLLASSYGSESEEENEPQEPHSVSVPPSLGSNCTKPWSQTQPPSSLPRRSADSDAPSFKISKTVGYVMKRKRQVQEDPGSSILETSSDSVSNVLSCYLSSESGGPATKQAKGSTRVPKRCVRSLLEHTKPTMSLEWHPTHPRLLLSASLDGRVKLWDIGREQNGGGCIASYEFHGAAVRDVEWISDETAMTAGYDNTAVCMDVGYGREKVRLKHEAYVTVVNLHPSDKNTVLTGDFSGKLQFWDLRSGKAEKQFKGAGGKILDAVFLPRQGYLVASSDIVRRNAFSKAMNVWDLASTVTLTHQLYFEPFTCPCLRVHPRRDEFLAQSNGNYVVLFSSQKPFKLNKHKRFQGHSVSGFDVGFDVSPDGGVLCSASSEGKVHFYDYASARTIRKYFITDSACLSVAWNQNASCRVAVSDWNGGIHILE